jgi:ABC-2 type transport system permease protein
MNPRHIGADFRVVARSYLRNSAALFFSLIFPIILILLFGAIFSNTGSVTVTVPVLNEDGNSPLAQQFFAALNQTTLIKVQVVTDPSVTPSNFATWLGQNGAAVGLLVPHGFASNVSEGRPVNLTLFTNPQDAESAGTAQAAVQGVANAFNFQLANKTPLILLGPGATVGSQIYKYIDFLIPGLIGFTILTSPMFSMVDITNSYRKDGIFRELSLTPITRAEWLTSRVIWYVLLSCVTAGIMIAAGVALFGAHVSLTLGLVPYLIVGPFLFVSLGMLAGSVAKTPESAAIIGNIITFPMMFLSGTFFPVSDFPSWLVPVAHVLPLYYVIDGMNQVMLFQNASRAAFDLAVIFVTSVVIFLAAIRFFRWRDE